MRVLLAPAGGSFSRKTFQRQYRTLSVLLTIGRRGTPRKLNVPGEDLSKVTYRLIDPEQYRGQRVLVVVVGDSALEAAFSLSGQPDTNVTLSCRSEAFGRAKEKNRKRVSQAVDAGQLLVLFKSNVKRVARDHVEREHDRRTTRLANDAVIVNAGGILPTPFLERLGIEIETKHGTE